MPTKNIVKEYGEGQYYHVYNRGVAKTEIFIEDADYIYMLSLFKKHLSGEESIDKFGRPAADYSKELDLIAYCLMPNHYHMMVFLKEKDGLVHFMRSVMTAYSMYFNKKYKRVGALFQNHFLASRITNEAYYWHISRYIHLNPMDTQMPYLEYPYSSVGYYLDNKHAKWLHPEHVLEEAGSGESYQRFLADYEDMHRDLAHIKHQLANKVEID